MVVDVSNRNESLAFRRRFLDSDRNRSRRRFSFNRLVALIVCFCRIFRRAGNHQPSNCVLCKSATDSLLRLDARSSMRTGGIFLRPKRKNENGKRPLETWIFCEDNCVSLWDSPFYKRNTVDSSTWAEWQSGGRKKQDMLQLLKTSSELFLSLTFLFWAFIIPSN